MLINFFVAIFTRKGSEISSSKKLLLGIEDFMNFCNRSCEYLRAFVALCPDFVFSDTYFSIHVFLIRYCYSSPTSRVYLVVNRLSIRYIAVGDIF